MSNEAIESYQCPHCGCVKTLTIDTLRAKLEVAKATLEVCRAFHAERLELSVGLTLQNHQHRIADIDAALKELSNDDATV